MIKKALLGIALGSGLLYVASMAPVSALSIDDLQSQISSLLSQIQTLTAQLNALKAQQTTDVSVVGSPGARHRICQVLYRDISPGMRGDDVLGVQQFLQDQGYFEARVTGYYGPVTAAAVAKWQASQGVSPAGTFGPLSRARISLWCGVPLPTPTPAPTCQAINYMPPLCADGSASQPQHNEIGCIIGYECAQANYAPPTSCKAWNDGCNSCSRQYPGGPAACTMRACFAAGRGYCSVYFDNPSTGGNRPPVISSFSGPTVLTINQTGTWSVNASDPENGQLSYQVTWGDEYLPYGSASNAALATPAFVQTTTFTHAYANVGTYTVTIVVHNASGQSARTSTTVQITGSVVCTQEYAPVCGQPPEPACRHSIPACMIATPGPQTYSNMCYLNAAGASFLYSGVCTRY